MTTTPIDEPPQFEVYTDDILGFDIEIPIKWKNKYTIEPNIGARNMTADERDSVAVITLLKMSGHLCYIFRYTQDEWAESGYGELIPVAHRVMAENSEFIYVMIFPGDVQYDHTDKEQEKEYREMQEDFANAKVNILE